MAIGKASDFKIYEEEFWGGATEVEAQNTNAFNAASRNAVRLIPAKRKGDFSIESFVDQVASLVSRRDTTSVAAATDIALTQDESTAVKVNRAVGPVSQTMDAWKKIAPNEDGQRMMSFIIGQQFAKAKLADQLNTGLIALESAIGGETALQVANAGTLVHSDLIDALALFGDAASQIVCWVMHSGAFFDLMGAAVGSSGFDGIASAVIREGTVASLGRPVIVTDSAALTTGSGSTLKYQTLGLVKNALVIENDTEVPSMVSEVVTGLDNLVIRIQGEFAYNIGIKGFKWDVANGAANPSDATLGTASNWDKSATQDKMLAGVEVETDG